MTIKGKLGHVVQIFYWSLPISVNTTLKLCNRVCTGHGKPGKSWNLRILFSRPGMSWNLIVGPWKSWRIKFLLHRSVTADDKTRTMYDTIMYRGQKLYIFLQMAYIWWTPGFVCLLNLYLRSKSSLKQGKVWMFWKVTAKPMVMENLKSSWKKS